MASHVWTVLCSKVSVDRESNNISLFDVTEQISIHYSGELPKGPMSLPGEFQLVSLWMRSNNETPERPKQRVKITGPDALSVVGPELLVDLSSAPRARAVLTLAGLPVSGSGYHFLSVELKNEGDSKWESVVRVPLEIKFIPESGK